MEVKIEVQAENSMTGQRSHTNTAYAVFVAMGEDGKPVPVPALIAETEEEKQRQKESVARQARRLTERT